MIFLILCFVYKYIFFVTSYILLAKLTEKNFVESFICMYTISEDMIK